VRKFIALIFLIPGHFLILIAGLVYANSLNWHLDMLEEDITVMKITNEAKQP
jgi:hypothetical protein